MGDAQTYIPINKGDIVTVRFRVRGWSVEDGQCWLDLVSVNDDGSQQNPQLQICRRDVEVRKEWPEVVNG